MVHSTLSISRIWNLNGNVVYVIRLSLRPVPLVPLTDSKSENMRCDKCSIQNRKTKSRRPRLPGRKTWKSCDSNDFQSAERIACTRWCMQSGPPSLSIFSFCVSIPAVLVVRRHTCTPFYASLLTSGRQERALLVPANSSIRQRKYRLSLCFVAREALCASAWKSVEFCYDTIRYDRRD